MFFLTMLTSTGAVSPRPALSAADALRTWQAEEARWFRVICLDQHHNVLTKGQLRERAAQVQAPAEGGSADVPRPAATAAWTGPASAGLRMSDQLGDAEPGPSLA